MVLREDAFKSLPLLLKRKALFSLLGDNCYMYTGELHSISMAFFKSFPLLSTLQKTLYFSLKGDQNKKVQKEISFCSQGLHQFSPASASILCKHPSFHLNEKRIGNLHFPFNCKGDSLRFSDFQTEEPPQVSCVG